jgi:hypothetical protein
LDWDAFWSMMILMTVWVPMILIWTFALMDLLHRRDLSGWSKGVWLLGIIFFPILGVALYFILKPAGTWADI